MDVQELTEPFQNPAAYCNPPSHCPPRRPGQASDGRSYYQRVPCTGGTTPRQSPGGNHGTFLASRFAIEINVV